MVEVYEDAKRRGRVYRPRRDQVLCIEGLLTASPQFFRPFTPQVAGEYDKRKVVAIRERVLPFLNKVFGKNLIRVEQQLDEVTPHWQYAVLPVDDGGRWSAKNVMNRRFLGELWGKWYDATRDLGLKRGQSAVLAEHSPIRKFYAAANEFERMTKIEQEKTRVQPFILKAPRLTEFLNPKTFVARANEAIDAWAKTESKRVNKLISPLIAAVAGAPLKSRKAAENRKSADKHAQENLTLKNSIERLEGRLLVYSAISPKDVVSSLGLPGIPKPLQTEDAIGLVAKWEGLDQQEALGWLSSTFGTQAAAATWAERARIEFVANAAELPKPSILSAAEIGDLVERQFDALRADSYSIVLRSLEKGKIEQKPYLGADRSQTTWKDSEIRGALLRLKFENGRASILLVPNSDEYLYVAISGRNSVDVLRNQGIDACLALQLPGDQEQAIVRLPADNLREKRVKKLERICRELGLGIAVVDDKTCTYLAGLRIRHIAQKARSEADATPIVGLLHAMDITERVGIDWAKALRPGSEPE